MANIPTLMESKSQDRFIVKFTNFSKNSIDDIVLSKQVFSVKLPSTNLDESNTELDQLKIVIIDDIGNLVDTAIKDRINTQLTNNNDEFSCSIDLLNMNNKSIKSIVYPNCKLSSVKYSELCYVNNDSCKFTLHIDIGAK